MGAFIRLMVAAPLAALITAIMFLWLYNQLSPNPFLYTTPEEPNTVHFGVDELYPPIIICVDCGWVPFPEKPETSNPWSDSEKAVKDAPQLAGSPCDSDCLPISAELEITKPRREMQGHTIGPQYPRTCMKKGAEGVVTVRFDVTPEGRVTNIVILDTPDDCFIQTVISNLQKWRYKVRQDEDGKPVSRYGIIESFTFELTD